MKKAKLKVFQSSDDWKRYKCEDARLVFENLYESKTVRIYNLGIHNLKTLALAFGVDIKEFNGTQWIELENSVVIFA